MINNLIFDRTESDVEQGTDKGYYRYTDLNRVQAAVLAVRERFIEMGYNVAPIPTFHTWEENDIPLYPQIEAYINSIRSLIGLIPIPDAPSIPDNPNRLDWIGANAIEKFLYMLDESADRISEAWFYSDEVFSNEVDA